MRWGLMLVLLAGCSSEATLIVQVRTDVAPNAFAEATVDVRGQTARLASDAARDWGVGVRVAEVLLEPGEVAFTVALRDESGARIVSRPVRTSLEPGALRVVTVLLTQDCAGVACPDPGGDASRSACLAGRCVQEGCTEEAPELCDEPECTSSDMCGVAPPPGGCATLECTPSGACLTSLDHGRCGDGEVCVARGGLCLAPAGGLTDPGPGHAHFTASNGGGLDVFRLTLTPGASPQSVSEALDVYLARDERWDASAGLSQNGEWLSLVVRRGGCVDCVLVAPTRDLSRAELIDVDAQFDGGTTLTDDGGTVVYEHRSGELRLVSRDGAGGWLPPIPLSEGTGYTFHSNPRFRRDGARVLFLCGNDRYVGQGICHGARDGTGAEVLTPELGSTSIALSSPLELSDGTILYSQTTSTSQELWSLPMMTGVPTRFGTLSYHQPCQIGDRVFVSDDSTIYELMGDGSTILEVPLAFPTGVGLPYMDSCGL